MKRLFAIKNSLCVLLSLIFLMLLSSCARFDESTWPESQLSEFELDVIQYFKEIALGFESGGASEITRRWTTPMRIFVDGNPDSLLLTKVYQTVNDINALATDGFSIELTTNLDQSNCYIFFGEASDFIERFPETRDRVQSNLAIFNVWWNNNVIYRARIFIDTYRTNLTQQRSLILEEITQSLGLGQDSPLYQNSIFFETPYDGGFATEYLIIDKELIRLLYHPLMRVGLDESQVDELLKKILISEQI